MMTVADYLQLAGLTFIVPIHPEQHQFMLQEHSRWMPSWKPTENSRLAIQDLTCTSMYNYSLKTRF